MNNLPNLDDTQFGYRLPSVVDIQLGFRESRKVFDDAKEDPFSSIPLDFITSEDALSQMENARRKFVQDQFEELYNKIQHGIDECCEEYRKKGISEGLQVRINTRTLALENREALEKAGYQLEADLDEPNYSWIRVNISAPQK